LSPAEKANKLLEYLVAEEEIREALRAPLITTLRKLDQNTSRLGAPPRLGWVTLCEQYALQLAARTGRHVATSPLALFGYRATSHVHDSTSWSLNDKYMIKGATQPSPFTAYDDQYSIYRDCDGTVLLTGAVGGVMANCDNPTATFDPTTGIVTTTVPSRFHASDGSHIAPHATNATDKKGAYRPAKGDDYDTCSLHARKTLGG
jgi:hypothetical protein